MHFLAAKEVNQHKIFFVHLMPEKTTRTEHRRHLYMWIEQLLKKNPKIKREEDEEKTTKPQSQKYWGRLWILT